MYLITSTTIYKPRWTTCLHSEDRWKAPNLFNVCHLPSAHRSFQLLYNKDICDPFLHSCLMIAGSSAAALHLERSKSSSIFWSYWIDLIINGNVTAQLAKLLFYVQENFCWLLLRTRQSLFQTLQRSVTTLEVDYLSWYIISNDMGTLQ